MTTPKQPAPAPDPEPLEHVSHDSLAAALAAFQGEMPVVRKDERAQVPTKGGGGYSYTYADLASIQRVVMPLLARHGIAYVCVPRRLEDGSYELAGRLLHETGRETIEGSLPLFGRSAQDLGSALTYARRYLLGALTSVVTDDDDDGAAASREPQRTRSQSRPSAPPPDEPPPPPHEPGEPRQTRRPAPPSAGDAASGRPMSDRTRAAMFATFAAAGITDPDDQRRGMADLLGHPVESRGAITEEEARIVIAAVDQYRTAHDPRNEG